MPVSEPPPGPFPEPPVSPVHEVPSIADGIEHELDPRALSVAQIGAWITTGVLSLLVLFGLMIVALVVPVSLEVRVLIVMGWFPVTLLLVWWAWRWPSLVHRYTSYRVEAGGIEIRRGVYWRSRIYVPRSRVQHTDVSQGPIERHYGLGKLIMYTAGTEFAQVELHGLDHARALRIRDHLLPETDDDAV